MAREQEQVIAPHVSVLPVNFSCKMRNLNFRIYFLIAFSIYDNCSEKNTHKNCNKTR